MVPLSFSYLLRRPLKLPRRPDHSIPARNGNRTSQSAHQLTIGSSLVDVRLHGLVAVLGTEVALSGEEELDVLLGGLEGGGELVGGHVDDEWFWWVVVGEV